MNDAVARARRNERRDGVEVRGQRDKGILDDRGKEIVAAGRHGDAPRSPAALHEIAIEPGDDIAFLPARRFDRHEPQRQFSGIYWRNHHGKIDGPFGRRNNSSVARRARIIVCSGQVFSICRLDRPVGPSSFPGEQSSCAALRFSSFRHSSSSPVA